jgi:hypothetical protein
MQLWNSFHQDIFMSCFSRGRHGIQDFFLRIWLDSGFAIDEYPGDAEVLRRIKGAFLGGDWWHGFEILETALTLRDVMGFPRRLAVDSINIALAGSAYILVNDEITERLPVEQSASIETALSSPFSSARTHFEKAFGAWNRRPECEPGDVIRESIHGVEATCRELCGDQNADLGKALATLDKRYQFHPVLRQAIEKLYAWTGDASGVRHAEKATERGKPGKAEARLALVICSSVANYLVTVPTK